MIVRDNLKNDSKKVRHILMDFFISLLYEQGQCDKSAYIWPNSFIMADVKHNDSLAAFLQAQKDFKQNIPPALGTVHFADFLKWKEIIRLEEIRDVLTDISAELSNLKEGQ